MYTCPQVGSMFNEGIWTAQTKTWEGRAIPRFLKRGRNGQFLEAWLDIARCLGIRPSLAKSKAVANPWDHYCTFQRPNPLNYAALTNNFCRHCTVPYGIKVSTKPGA